MAGTPPKTPTRTSSLASTGKAISRPASTNSNFTLYKGFSERPLGWKHRRSSKLPTLGSTASDMSVRRWDGAARSSTEWDGLRRDPELWFPNGNCLVHLYERGQSRRGPAFKLPMDALIATNCYPLIKRFLVEDPAESPVSQSSSEDGYFYDKKKTYELYIPAPLNAERGEAFLYHTATRNLLAWVFGKSLVGNHLGGALVGLLNSMVEFRSLGEDNIEAIMDYMDEEGYADMRNSPDHALAILFFAEHFHFKDLWIDAFAHCSGMNERLPASAGFDFMSRTSRALVTRSRFEMNMRLDSCGRRLSAFLSDDLSDAHLGLSSGARSHLDKFRSFLQSYYVAKLGYYPPASAEAGSAAFPKPIYSQMCTEFQKLYDFLVDPSCTAEDTSPPISQQGGICVWQNVQAFDLRHKYLPLMHPLPLLPEVEEAASPRSALNRRFSFAPKADKMKPDPRLVTFSSLSKATNRSNQSLLECSLVRAYRGFEKDCIFSPSKADKHDKLSFTDARKVRWILVYAILQTLLSATRVPEQVRDTQNVPYSLSVIVAGCPPWKGERPYETLIRTQTDQTKEDFKFAQEKPIAQTAPVTPLEIKPDIDYFAQHHKADHVRKGSDGSISTGGTNSSKKSSVRRALSTLGNMPELRHPRPQRASYHEILVHGYGNGTNEVSITAEPISADDNSSRRKNSSDSGTSSVEDLSSRWSNTDAADSPTTSLSSSRRGSDASVKDFLESYNRPMTAPAHLRMGSISSTAYSASVYEDSTPDALSMEKLQDEVMRVTKEIKVEWEEKSGGPANDELLAYLKA
ncbi:uncharacterized protein LY89DRAFT_681755 [Mollisia scopiformis]|uniref:DUF8004 domain-containing protein n=1 Tax=Mollisia scopiformis TaxID=149040 RepID=A0A194XLY4_MOLSC|nr:uncharacterized protein LY89DRAFT_681755 [Mollisia scopiformis]KUJ21146.1 hypothetical protein LY89DRAFT_681755 [Mollisia scopiformis]